MKIARASSGSTWERSFGYARATRAGALILVSGTLGADALGRPAAPDAHGQTRAALAIVDEALRRLGGGLDTVMRLRVHFVDPDVGPGVLAALHEAFGEALPALTTVRVAGLADPAFLVELEAEAVVRDDGDPAFPRARPGGDEEAD